MRGNILWDGLSRSRHVCVCIVSVCLSACICVCCVCVCASTCCVCVCMRVSVCLCMCMPTLTVIALVLCCTCHIQNFRAGEKILDRQWFQFPPTWVYVDNVEGEWGAFNEIMKRKDFSTGRCEIVVVNIIPLSYSCVTVAAVCWLGVKCAQGEIQVVDILYTHLMYTGHGCPFSCKIKYHFCMCSYY